MISKEEASSKSLPPSPETKSHDLLDSDRTLFPVGLHIPNNNINYLPLSSKIPYPSFKKE